MSLILKASVSPVITGGALWLLLKGPENLRQPTYDYLNQILRPQNIGRLITSLKWLFALGLVRNLALALNTWAGNSFNLRSSKNEWKWDKEIAVITGGSGGFGQLFARDLSKNGIHVVILDVTPLPPHLQNNPKISFFKCDVTDPDVVNQVAEQVKSTVGHPSILINNAGIGGQSPITKTTPKNLQKLFGVNLFSHYYTVQAFLPNMLARKKGHIISIASMASFYTTSSITDYSSSKAAVMAFHEGLSAELRTVHRCPEIRTTIVHPFFADTPIIAKGKAELQKAGVKILDPQTVSDAVVDQIMNARGGPIVLSNGFGHLVRGFRALPFWLQEGVKRLSETDLSHLVRA